MKIALIQCPVWGTREPPLSVVQLSASLKSRGHETKSFDLNNYLYRNRSENYHNLWAWEQCSFWYNKDNIVKFFNDISGILNEYAQKILSYNPSIISFSLASSTYCSTIEFAKLLKDKNKNIKIVYGGQLFYDKRNIESAFNESPVDYIIPGEGDIAFPELAACIEQNKDVSKCRGIYLRKNGKISFTEEMPLLKNLNNIPYMDFTDLKIEDYDDNEHLAIMSSRGCVWSCAFCSSKSFWKSYREMSAERLHQEICFHKMERPWMGHIDFQDLVFNANIERMKEFCELMEKYPPYGNRVVWLANAIINPKMTRDVLDKMAAVGCKKLIFGIESGSERILSLMNKKYKIEDAKRVIKDTAEAGIQVTCNFMFGLPGETEEDFQKTLDFVKDIGKYLERAYPSRTYCALEEFSYFHEHPEEFGIKTPFSHHLYWQTKDGTNTYPVRLKRCQRFEQLCHELGVKIDCGVKTDVLMDEWFNLGYYYEYMGEDTTALEYFTKYHEKDPSNEIINIKLKELKTKSETKAKKI